ncbi:MAG: hypothetical protein BGO40_07075 [Chryseobacterium sp. 39-10]|nr:hypothetical protein [Chryseobacterium sp.]OJV48245.1 MAG: hypothetical protein BGO40_07075 [Chryseobacterium sp. 39-10]
MKKLIVILLICILNIVNAQTKYSISFSPIGLYTDFKSDKLIGFNGNAEFSKHFNKNIISIYCSVGLGVTIQNKKTYNGQGYFEADALYSRRYFVNNFLVIEPQLGFGYIGFGTTSDQTPKNFIGFPVRIKAMAFTNNKFALGLYTGSNFNSYKSIYSLGTLFNFNF